MIAGVNRSTAPGPIRCRVAGPETIGHCTTDGGDVGSLGGDPQDVHCSEAGSPQRNPAGVGARAIVRTKSIAAWRSLTVSAQAQSLSRQARRIRRDAGSRRRMSRCRTRRSAARSGEAPWCGWRRIRGRIPRRGAVPARRAGSARPRNAGRRKGTRSMWWCSIALHDLLIRTMYVYVYDVRCTCQAVHMKGRKHAGAIQRRRNRDARAGDRRSRRPRRFEHADTGRTRWAPDR